jgi:PAS domain S-box-containing protein
LALLLVLTLSVLAQQPPPAAAPLEKVRLQLKWVHMFQFAGFYAALEKGYYAEAGLEVEILEGRSGVDFIKEVATGKVEYGTEMPDLLLRRQAGEPVVVLAAIFQHSPIALISLAETGIKSPHDLVGRRVMLRPTSNADLRAMMIQEGVALNQVKLVDHSFDMEDLVKGRAEAISGYFTANEHAFKARGIAVTMLKPINYGIDFYGDCLFTSESELRQHPERVRAFRSASLRGWSHAMDHPEEIARLIQQKYAPKRSMESLLAEAEAMQPLFLHKFVEIGHMNPGRWRHIGDTYAKDGLLPANYSLKGFLYNPEQAPDHTWLKWLAGGACLGLLALILVVAILFAFNRKLDSAVQERTAKLEQLNADLEAEVRERKGAEQQNLLLAQTLKSARDCISVTDLQNRILFVNQALLDTYGYSESEMLGQGPQLFRPAKTVPDPEQDAVFQGTLRGEWHGEVVNRRKDGTEFTVELWTSVVRDRTGAPTAMVGVARDITARKQLEEQFRQVQKMDAVGQLAGGVAHDFNNILAAMMMNLDLLQEVPNQGREIHEGLTDLETQTRRAASLTRQLLMFSRRSVLEMQVLNLNEVVDNLLRMLGRLLGEHIRLIFDQSPHRPHVEADAGMLEQVVMNLAVNARDAMPRGGRITFTTGTLEIGLEPEGTPPRRPAGRYVQLSVSDTGCGMEEATLKRIFEPFFTTKEPGKGTGLGLATVHGIVAQHRGWVEVESSVGQGTTFKVILPATTKGLPGSSAPAEKDGFIRGRETILLVEDEGSVRQMAARVLRQLGYPVLEAGNGQEAMKVWQEQAGQIDLLLSDMVMPEGLTGMDLAEKFQQDKPSLRIILSSGYTVEMVGQGRPTAKGFVYLQKPYHVEELSRVVRDCLDRA